jgi:hypothetical protein
VYFTTRRVFNEGGKTLNPRMPKRPILFNYDTCKNHKTVWVGEGPFDAYSFPNEGVAVLGSYIDEMQVDLFGTMDCEEIVLCLDPDAADKMRKMAHRLWEKYRETKTISMIFLQGEADPNDLGPEKLQSLYEEKVEFGVTEHLKLKDKRQEKKFLTKQTIKL